MPCAGVLPSPWCTVRYLPLGSPSGRLKRLSGITPAPLRPTYTLGAVGSGVPGWVRVGGYWEGGIPGTYPPTTDWYCQGPTNDCQRLLRPPMALQAPPGPSAHHGLPALNIPS